MQVMSIEENTAIGVMHPAAELRANFTASNHRETAIYSAISMT